MLDLAELDSAEQAVLAVAGLRGGRLRVSAFATAARFTVPALAAFRRKPPEVRVSFVEIEPEKARHACDLDRIESELLDDRVLVAHHPFLHHDALAVALRCSHTTSSACPILSGKVLIFISVPRTTGSTVDGAVRTVHHGVGA